MKLTAKNYANEILTDIERDNIKLYDIREKNINFLSKYGLDENYVKDIIVQLNSSVFKERIPNDDPKINTNYLYVFDPVFQLVDEYGLNNMVHMYIKICNLKSGITLVVSFHENE